MKIQIDVDDAVKLRDHNQALADTWNDILEKNAPPEVKAQKPTEAQFNGLRWALKKGTRGDYEQAENDKTENFRIVSQHVKAHNGFCNLYGFKIWLHNQDENRVDRKR